MSCENTNQINHIIDNHCGEFLCKKNVVGVAYGNKCTDGMDTGEPCLQVLVSQKLPMDDIKPEDQIPEEYHGEMTDVTEIGSLRAQGFTSKVRPMLFGYSIGPSFLALAGTAGCLVYDANNYYILSNNHVMAGENLNPIGTPIIQPAIIEGGVNPRDLVANLTKFVPIKYTTATTTPANLVDAAIAKIVNVPNLVSRNIAIIGGVKGTVNATLNLPVRKSGRTTGYTTGNVLYTNAAINVGYSGGKVALYTNQIITTAMSAPGDSGSLVVDNSSKAVGLLFAGSSTVTVLNPINTVLSLLGVRLALN